MQEVIDFHAHIYPAKIAVKAAQSIGDFYGVPMFYDGTSGTLLQDGLPGGIRHYVVHSVATKPEQAHSINDFIAGECAMHPEFIGFGTLHPALTERDADAEIEHIEQLGLHGVKMHPDFQKFNIDDGCMDHIYRRLSGKFPILLHMGDPRYDYSSAKRLASVLDRFPDLTVIAAHFGGYQRWDEAEEFLLPRRCYLDTSSTIAIRGVEACKESILKFGADRFLFGSDYPMWSPTEELQRFLSFGLSEEENRMILSGNAKKLLHLE